MAAAAAAAASAWPTSLCDLSQALTLAVLRGNAGLCHGAPASLLELFAHVADASPDVSTAPALDLFFVLAKPEDAADREHQKVDAAAVGCL